MKTKNKTKGIEISHWKTGDADDFHAMDFEEVDCVDQEFPETDETELMDKNETIIRDRPTRRCSKV